MKMRYIFWYVLGACATFLPVGFRVLSWNGSPPGIVDAAMARQGQTLFNHEWVPNDPLSPGGDGLGPVYNATSCVACHHQGGTGGSGGLEHNVTVFSLSPVGGGSREGVVHAHAVNHQETLAQIHPDLELPEESQPTLEWVLSFARKPAHEAAMRGRNSRPTVHISQRNTPALFGANWIDKIPDRAIIKNERRQRLRWGDSADSRTIPVGRATRLPDGRIGKFGWKGQSASLADFVQAACANELGLGNPGAAQPRPLSKPDYQPAGLDLTLEQCNQLTAFIASLPRPVERLPDDIQARNGVPEGKKLFTKIGCADCHTPNFSSVEGLYSDLLLHRMGERLEGIGSYNQPPGRMMDISSKSGPPQDEWRTPPLWGVADSAPYLHDGRAPTLAKAIEFHGGQAARSSAQFASLGAAEKAQLIEFLKSLRAP